MNDELGPRAEAIAVGGDAAPMQLDQGLDQGQPESDASRSVFLRALPESFRSNRDCNSGAIPLPLSRTRSTISPGSASAVSRISPPGSVYLAALASRFVSTCSEPQGVGGKKHRRGWQRNH